MTEPHWWGQAVQEEDGTWRSATYREVDGKWYAVPVCQHEHPDSTDAIRCSVKTLVTEGGVSSDG